MTSWRKPDWHGSVDLTDEQFAAIAGKAWDCRVLRSSFGARGGTAMLIVFGDQKPPTTRSCWLWFASRKAPREGDTMDLRPIACPDPLFMQADGSGPAPPGFDVRIMLESQPSHD